MALELETIRESVRAMDWYEQEKTRPPRNELWCTGCGKRVYVRLTNGEEIYPHREDLETRPFWICDMCGAFVGTHWKTDSPTLPMGVLATPEIRNARRAIHAMLDPLWQSKLIDRRAAYAHISERFGRTYHTGQLYTLAEAKRVYAIVSALKKQLAPSTSPWNR